MGDIVHTCCRHAKILVQNWTKVINILYWMQYFLINAMIGHRFRLRENGDLFLAQAGIEKTASLLISHCACLSRLTFCAVRMRNGILGNYLNLFFTSRSSSIERRRKEIHCLVSLVKWALIGNVVNWTELLLHFNLWDKEILSDFYRSP